MEASIQHVYVGQSTWVQGYWPIEYGNRIINWPLPRHRVYEMTIIGPTWYILHNYEHHRPIRHPVREGEGQ